MASRNASRRSKGSLADVEAGVATSRDEGHDGNFGLKETSGWMGLLIALGLLGIMGTAAYFERNILSDMARLGPAAELRALADLRRVDELAAGTGVPPLLPNHVGATPSRPVRQQIALTSTVAKLAVKQHPGGDAPRSAAQIAEAAAALAPATAPAAAAPNAAGPASALGTLTREELEVVVAQRTKAVRALKAQKKVFETDPEAKAAAQALQEACKHLIPLKYGPEPHMLELKLHFPESMPDYVEKGASGTVLVEMAPVDLMPYSVLTFLDMVSNEWKGGAFHRNAPHVKQVTVQGRHPGFPLAFQEYSAQFPHKKYTLGFAGRPSSSAFYVSTVDNSRNHGPGSQGSTTEADACFAKIVGAENKAGPYVDVVKRLEHQPGGQPPNGFIGQSSNHVVIESFKLLKSR